MHRSAGIATLMVSLIVIAGVSLPSPSANSEPGLIGEGLSCEVPLFIQNRCSTCHDAAGNGAQRPNLTARGIEYQAKGLGCIASATSIAAQAKPGPDGPPAEPRLGMVRGHFISFNCQQCHNIDGKGKTRSNLVDYGMDMHHAGKGCISCLNAAKRRAGRTDLLEVPKYD